MGRLETLDYGMPLGKAKFETDKDDDFILWLILFKECLIWTDDNCLVVDCDENGNQIPVLWEAP